MEPGGSKPNEDWIGISPTAMLVLDGVTVPDGIDTGCVHGTPWYVDTLGRAILHLCNDHGALDLRQVLRRAIEAARNIHKATCDVSAPGTPAATVALFRVNSDGCDYLVLSDAFMIAEMSDGRLVAVTDRTLDSLATAERAAVYRLPIGTPEHTEALLRMVRKQIRLRNQRGGYWVAAAEPCAADHAIIGRFALSDVRRAAVLTDGAARLVEPFNRWDWRQLLDVADASAHEVIARTRRLEQADAKGRRWPRYKTSDDAAIAYCDLRAHATSSASGSRIASSAQ
jgi:hypothetical protein